MSTRERLLAAAAAVLVGTAVAWACGPFFPAQLLDDREATLRATPANSFAWEAARLVEATDRLSAVEADPYSWSEEPAEDPEQDGLDAPQRRSLAAMRAAGDGEAAWAAGAGLPEAVRLYTAGAQDWRAAHAEALADAAAPAALLDRARARFEAVLALPAAEAGARAVWAAYMLGRLHAEVGSRAAAIDAWERARALALGGAPDPRGLAAASLGEQARLFLVAADGRRCGWTELFGAEDGCVDGVPVDDLRQAVQLYAAQAARGSRGAVASLGAIAAWALREPARVERLIHDPVARRLLVAYALVRVDAGMEEMGGATDEYWSWDIARGEVEYTRSPMLETLADALQRSGADGGDRLAALAYRIGRYDLAGTLAESRQGPLAAWVKAKLALRRGEVDAAARLYAEAVEGFPTHGGSLDPYSASLLGGEQAVLTLARGEYVEALDQLFRGAARDRDPVGGRFMSDMAYIAERVLTLDELRTWVDVHAPPSPPPAPMPPPGTPEHEAWLAAHPITPAVRLRYLLARRLVREGRVDDALPYFPEDEDPRFLPYDPSEEGLGLRSRGGTPVRWQIRAKAREYRDARMAAEKEHGVDGAESWYLAAEIARWQGMEIMGAEQGPDFKDNDGSYAWGSGPSKAWDGWGADVPVADSPTARADLHLAGPFIRDEERHRYAASEPAPWTRFHYRSIAADHLVRAADQLPPRSQAFAAVLCRAAQHLSREPERAAAMYQRYLDEGALVPFAVHFGHDCPEPDFAAARRFGPASVWGDAERWVRQHARHLVVALGVAALGAIAVGGWAMRRRTAGRAPPA